MFSIALDAHGIVSTVGASVAVRLAILALWYFSLFVGFFNFFLVYKREVMEKILLSLFFGSKSTKKRGRGVLVCW